jgi:hypothetical protein
MLPDEELFPDSESPRSRELYFFMSGDTLGRSFACFGGVLFSLFWIGVEKECWGMELAEVGVCEGFFRSSAGMGM